MLQALLLVLFVGLNFTALAGFKRFLSFSQKVNQVNPNRYLRNDIPSKLITGGHYRNGAPMFASIGTIVHNIRNEFVVRNRGELLKLAVVAVIATISSVSVPLFFSKVLEALTAPLFDLRALLKPLSMMLLCHTIEPLMTILYIRKCSYLIDRFVSSLRMSVYSNILRRDVSSFELNSPLSSTQLVIGEIDKIKVSAMANISRDRGARAALELMSGLGILYSLCLPLAMFFSTIIPFTAYVSSRFADGLSSAAAREGEASLKQSNRAQETISNFKEVFSFSNQLLEEKRFSDIQYIASQAAIKTGNAKAFFEAANRAGIYANILTLFAVGGVLVSKKLVQPVVLVSFIGYCFSLNFATQGLLFSFGDIQSAGTSWAKVQKFIRETSSSSTPGKDSTITSDEDSAGMKSNEILSTKFDVVKMSPTTASANEIVGSSIYKVSGIDESRINNDKKYDDTNSEDDEENGSSNIFDQTMDLILKDVSFAYVNRPDVVVLHNVSLHIPQGKVTALVGPSGAGKSTIAALLNRFYEPTSGQFTVNGKPSNEINRYDYLKHVSIVRQSPSLFTDTVANNIGKWYLSLKVIANSVSVKFYSSAFYKFAKIDLLSLKGVIFYCLDS